MATVERQLPPAPLRLLLADSCLTRSGNSNGTCVTGRQGKTAWHFYPKVPHKVPHTWFMEKQLISSRQRKKPCKS